MSNPYEEPGGLGAGNTDIYSGQGMGLYDLFNTYQHVNNMFGDTVEGAQAGLEAYDPYSEELMRKQYREDYRSMVGGITQSQKEQTKEMKTLRNQGGKSGFAGSGSTDLALKDKQRSYELQQRSMTGQLSNRKDQLMSNIQGERQAYDRDIWSAYSTWLSSSPEELSAADIATGDACMQSGGYIDSNGACIIPNTDDSTTYEDQFADWMQP